MSKVYSGELHIFDFDDTLMWGPHWQDTVKRDFEGYVIEHGQSPTIKYTLNLFNSLNEEKYVPDDFKNLRLKHTLAKQYYKNYFLVIDQNGKPVYLEDIQMYVNFDDLINSGLSGPSDQTKYAAVCNDLLFYKQPETAGGYGVNEKTMEIYRKVSDPIILTARAHVPGMRERIFNKICEHAEKPIEIYLQDINSPCSGTYKGHVIRSIAEQPTVEHIHFYEDHQGYIEKIEAILNLYDLRHKVTINKIDISNKPLLIY